MSDTLRHSHESTPADAVSHAGLTVDRSAKILRATDTIADEFAPEVRQPAHVDRVPETRRSSWFETRLRNAVHRRLKLIGTGELLLQAGRHEHRFGRHDPEDGLSAAIKVNSPDFYHRLAFGGSLGFAESFILGEWDSPSPRDVVRLFCRNLHVSDGADHGLVRMAKRLARRWHERHSNTRDGSRRNIHAHYDLGNDFYSLFLDETMTYSSGIFESENTTLRDAQVAKIDRLCRKLDLKPHHHLVEIGTGWGGFAVHAARNYGCRVTTTTISREQHEFAKQRVADAGLTDRVTLLLNDYRDLTGQFDRLVSVEMIEAVGHEFFDEFFRKCFSLLKPDGQMTLQGITISEQRYPRYLRTVDFIQRYIFPGGCLITPSAVLKSVASQTDMRLLHVEDISPHYARTLAEWRARFFERLDDVRQLGFSDTFIRLWEYYLSYCEAAFLEHSVGTVQMQFGRPRCHTDALRPFL